MTGLRRRRRDERGAVGGLEALLLGLLVVLGGVGLMVNTWTVIETRAALDAAAFLRRAVRCDQRRTSRLGCRPRGAPGTRHTPRRCPRVHT